MSSVALSITQSNNVKYLIDYLTSSKAPRTVHASALKPGGILDLIYNPHKQGYPAPVGGRRFTFMEGITGSIPMWNGSPVTVALLTKIRNDISGVYGPKFWDSVVMAGDIDATYTVSTDDDVYPTLKRYAEIYDKSGELTALRTELNEIRTLINTVKNTKNKRIKNAVAASTVARWTELERTIVGAIAEIEAFH